MHRRSMPFALLLFILLASSIGPLPAAAQTDPPLASHLIKDIYQAETEGSNPVKFMPSGPVTYFFATQADGQPALWKTDGTPGGTGLVRSGIVPGEHYYATYKGFLYFPAYTEAEGTELWRTDGSFDRTTLFAGLDSHPGGSQPRYLTAFEDRLYFAASINRFRSTDGTPEGMDFNDSVRIDSPMVEYKGSLYFSAYQPDYYGNNDQVYLAWFGSGGSGQTTDLAPGTPLIVYKDRLYFTASRADVGLELWSTGGTLESIRLLRDITPGGDSFIRNAVEYNGLLYFTVEDVDNGLRLWCSDGTESGTIPVFTPPAGSKNIDVVAAIQPESEGEPGGLLLEIRGAAGDRKLWRSDGTNGGTQLLVDLGVSPEEFYTELVKGALFHNGYYFPAYDVEHGVELWRTDGTVAGTAILADLWPGQRASTPYNFTPCGSRLCFSAEDGAHGQELWSTDGTPAGTALIADLNTHPANAYPGYFTPAGSLLYFLARDDIAESNLWRTDGTTSGTFALNLDPAVKIEPANIYGGTLMAARGTTLFFAASDPDHGMELWKTDGSPGGTERLKDIWPGKTSSNPRGLTVTGDRLFFVSTTQENGEALWVSDGTAGGTKMVKELFPNGPFYSINIAVFGNRVLFNIFRLNTPNCELWISDGSNVGTTKLSDNLFLQEGAEFDGKLYFTATQQGSPDRMLWETDGTAGGTKKVPVDIRSAGYYDNSSIIRLIPTQHCLFFIVQVYDGEFLFSKPAGGGESRFVQAFYNMYGVYADIKEAAGFGEQVAITVSMYTDVVDGQSIQLWASDGSEAGTLRMQAGFDNPTYLMPLGNTLFFSASDPDHGTQIWRTDGSSAGTQRVSAYAQNRCDRYNGRSLAFFKGQFILSLDDALSDPPGSGCELWSIDFLTEQVFLPVVGR